MDRYYRGMDTSKYEFIKVGTSRRQYLQAPSVRPVTTANGTMLVDQAVGDDLRREPIAIEVLEERYELPRALRRVAPSALEKVFDYDGNPSHQLLYNRDKLGMAGEIETDSAEDRDVIHLRRTTYFDGLCSNELAPYLIESVSGQIDVFDEYVCAYAQSHRRIRTFDESRLSNQIGVSTLAITSDDKLIITAQSDLNLHSPRLFAPSGSGSVDLSDYMPGDSLQELVIKAMERNLFEETGVVPGETERTTIVGFGRWLERGAKPEFFGVSRLRITAAEYNRAQTSNDRFTISVDALPIFNEFGREEDLRISGSVPLLVGLNLVAEFGA